jgi:hypothetical protein
MSNIIKCMRCKNNIIGSDICSDSNRKFCEDCLIIANNKISKKNRQSSKRIYQRN